ncbi:peroxidase 12-like [Gastrolobium bilobum]|uniref:peroxidase 12-like n=1 Tax=Gastrolobium bilobum TaxID=150636 RepID=UPI002AAFACD7|nr:peroxidase 12-like [Gastrolobium bilobum]
MARASTSNTPLYALLLISWLLFASQIHASSSEALVRPPIVDGLSWNYYWLTCPRLERIVRKHLQKVFNQDSGQAPALLRIFFHDCFVQGCDGSILLDGTPNERDQPANIGIRPEALQTIEDLRSLVHRQCGRVVSCADLIVLAAREAVSQSGGPEFDVPLGRKDGITFSINGTNNLPPPFFKTGELLDTFGARNFDATDVVALSGAHSFGRAHCSTFFDRINQSDPPIEESFANNLKGICPNEDSTNTSVLDVRTPKLFDNKYYINLLNRQGLFVSDQDLFSDSRTKEIVNSFASNQKLFFDKFANAILKLSQLDVLTGKQGQVRAKCSFPNTKKKSFVTSVVEEVVDLTGQV